MDEIVLEKQLEGLKEEHRKLDDQISTLIHNPFQDQLALMRLKRRKLQLRDEIFAIEEIIYPDIIA